MRFIIPKDISAEISMNKHFSIVDMLLLIIAGVLTWAFDSMVYSKLIVPYYIFSFSSAIYLVLKSSDNVGKRNYQSIYFSIFRDKETYHKIDNIYD